MPRNHHLVNAIFNEPWIISIANHQAQINALLAGILNPSSETEAQESEPVQIAGRVAVISINGALTKERGFCGEPGMQDYGAQISEVIYDNSIDAIVLKIYSPGGMVSGTDTLSTIIQNSTKPIVAFIDDMACSGAYWIACSCCEIVANNDICQVGSIGVMATYSDLRKANEMKGVTEHLVFAPQSTQKWGEYLQVLDGNYNKAQSNLSVIADKFMSHVRACRPSVSDDQLTGDVYFAKDVIGSLVDNIGTLDSAIQQALSLAQSPTKTNITMKTPKTTAMALAAGVMAFEITDGQLSLNSEQIEGIEASLDSIAAATQAAADGMAELATANARISALQAENSVHLARIAELEAEPGEKPAVVTPAVDAEAKPEVTTSRAAMTAAKEFLNQYS